MTQPPVTAILPVRDAETTLPRALRSLLNQTCPLHEVIVALNGCQDRSPEIAASFASENKSIRLIETPASEGVAGASRRACAEARNELLFRLDADDEAHPGRLAAQLAILLNHDADLVTSRIVVPDALGAGILRYVSWANHLKQPQDFAKERFVESPVIQPGTLMKKETYLRAGGYRVEDGPEDYDLWLRMLEAEMRFYQAEDAIHYWHDSSTRLTRSHLDYSKNLMTLAKARALNILAQRQKKTFLIAGAGPQGRRMVRHLQALGASIKGVFDVDPKKIGSKVHDVPVYPSEAMPPLLSQAILLGCVGHAGRARVRALALEAGCREGVDFFACC
ncbi:MAG: glycosyltransferase [Verrucomicrobiota bacterium JB023]|nr:glycosyltransferase [Verrucomicrobiota bacterium JB023]